MAKAFRQKGAEGGRASIEVEGAKEVRRALKRMDGNLADLREVHREAAQDVASEAKTLVPVQTGRLRDTIRTSARNVSAAVVAGKGLVPYAGPIHFGWHARNIEPQPFLYDAIDRRRDEVLDRYRQGVDSLVRRFDRDAPG